MLARARRSVLAVVVTAGLLVPSTTAVASGDDDELARARGELDGASRELDDVEAAVRRANDEVAAADERLRRASTELATVRHELTGAEAAAATASAAERTAARELQAVSEELTGLVGDHRDGRDRLASQALTAFKRGGARGPDLLFSGVVRAEDWHEVAVTREVVDQVLTTQRATVDADAALTLARAEATAGVADARRRAVATAREAAAERARVERLLTEQLRLVATVEREQRARAATLAALEEDAAARAVLVRGLEERVAELELAATTVRVPVRVGLPADGPPPGWASGLPEHGRPWAASIEATAVAHGLDGRLLAALVWTESNFRPDAVSHAGAIGLAQLMPGTARGLGVDPWDPSGNLAGGARYLAGQLDVFGRADLALAAYNAGPGRVRAAGAVPDIVETQLYVVRVLDRYRALTALG